MFMNCDEWVNVVKKYCESNWGWGLISWQMNNNSKAPPVCLVDLPAHVPLWSHVAKDAELLLHDQPCTDLFSGIVSEYLTFGPPLLLAGLRRTGWVSVLGLLLREMRKKVKKKLGPFLVLPENCLFHGTLRPSSKRVTQFQMHLESCK